MRKMRLADFPKGWPIRCPECDSWSFRYHTERTGNIRIYTCKRCGARYRAKWKGKPLRSAFGEPKNCKMEDFDWEKAPASGVDGSLTLFDDGEQI